MKKIVILCLSLLYVGVSIRSVIAEEDINGVITAEFAVAIDLQQNTVLYEKNADEKMYPASMTKVVTAIVALEMIDDLDETVTITENDLETIFETGASAAYFEVGEVVTYRDLVYGAILPSGADATRALAHNLTSNYQDFVGKMNDLVKELELENSNFVNTTGIHHDNHYTTPNELATLIRYAVANEDFLEIFSAYYYETSNGQHVWLNTGMFTSNFYGIEVDRIIGCKSGFTLEALMCLASLVEIDGREVITIVGKSDREIPGSANIDTNTIAQYVEATHAEVKIHTAGESIEELPVTFGVDAYYPVFYTHDVLAYLPISFQNSDLKYIYEFDVLEAPMEINETIGTIKIEYQGQVLYTQVSVLDRPLDRNNRDYYLHHITSFIFPYGLSIILIVIYILLLKYQPKRR